MASGSPLHAGSSSSVQLALMFGAVATCTNARVAGPGGRVSGGGAGGSTRASSQRPIPDEGTPPRDAKAPPTITPPAVDARARASEPLATADHAPPRKRATPNAPPAYTSSP